MYLLTDLHKISLIFLKFLVKNLCFKFFEILKIFYLDSRFNPYQLKCLVVSGLMRQEFFGQKEDPELYLEQGQGQRSEVYPHDLKVKLKVKLDPPHTFGKDWKMLASKLGLDE